MKRAPTDAARRAAAALLAALTALPAAGSAQAEPPGQALPSADAPGAETRSAPEQGAPAQDAPPTSDATAQGATPEAAPAAPPTTRAPAPTRRLIVIDAATYGIDPIVGRVATDRLRRTGAELGYEVLDAAQTVAAARELRMPYPPTPADLWRVSWVARAHRGVFARIWAAEGRYVIELVVASLDGAGPFFGRETASAAEFRAAIDRLLRQTLPSPAQWQESPPPAVAAARPAQTADRERPREELAHPGGIGVRLPEPPLRRFALTLQTEAVFGTTPSFFYNHLAGARFDVRITRDLAVGAYVGYANAEGRNDRVHNLLFLLQGEHRIRLSPTLDLTFPLRVAAGYMPYNGPVLRIAAGLSHPLGPDFEVGVDLVSPTFWFLPSGLAFSLDVAVEITYRFP